ncbi:MAG TPA: pyridoxal-phosphate dependent enzyme, partial [Flavobacteriales bacterium]|nr:pyridoxal-phosphate dependent enzyme [Flavobacteriales bacterium]
LRAVGADLVLVDPNLPPEHPDSYNKKVHTLLAEHPDYYFPDQHNNLDNNEAHYLTTGPEIWQQMDGQIDYIIAGVGTGGTLTGAARYLKEQDPNIQVIGVDPEGSVFYDYFKTGELIKPFRYYIEGLGDEELIKCMDFDIIDDMVKVSNENAFKYTRKLAKEEAILAGGSSGAAIYGVLKVLSTLPDDKSYRVVTIFPDSGNRYLSTIYNDDWLKNLGIILD